MNTVESFKEELSQIDYEFTIPHAWDEKSISHRNPDIFNEEERRTIKRLLDNRFVLLILSTSILIYPMSEVYVLSEDTMEIKRRNPFLPYDDPFLEEQRLGYLNLFSEDGESFGCTFSLDEENPQKTRKRRKKKDSLPVDCPKVCYCKIEKEQVRKLMNHLFKGSETVSFVHQLKNNETKPHFILNLRHGGIVMLPWEVGRTYKIE